MASEIGNCSKRSASLSSPTSHWPPCCISVPAHAGQVRAPTRVDIHSAAGCHPVRRSLGPARPSARSARRVPAAAGRQPEGEHHRHFGLPAGEASGHLSVGRPRSGSERIGLPGLLHAPVDPPGPPRRPGGDHEPRAIPRWGDGPERSAPPADSAQPSPCGRAAGDRSGEPRRSRRRPYLRGAAPAGQGPLPRYDANESHVRLVLPTRTHARFVHEVRRGGGELRLDGLILLRRLTRRESLDRWTAAELIQLPEGEAAARPISLRERGCLAARGRGRGTSIGWLPGTRVSSMRRSPRRTMSGSARSRCACG